MIRSARPALVAAAVLSAALVLSGCGPSTSSTGSGAGSTPSASTPSIDTTIGHDAMGVTVTGGFGEKPVITVGDQAASATQLQVVDLVEGDGDPVEPGAIVLADYAGVGASSMEQFDSSFDRGSPAQFSLDQVIPGWTLGIPGMKKGGRRLLIIPGALAYGANPPQGSGIEVDETLVFVVDMVDFLNPGQTPTPAAS